MRKGPIISCQVNLNHSRSSFDIPSAKCEALLSPLPVVSVSLCCSLHLTVLIRSHQELDLMRAHLSLPPILAHHSLTFDLYLSTVNQDFLSPPFFSLMARCYTKLMKKKKKGDRKRENKEGRSQVVQYGTVPPSNVKSGFIFEMFLTS